MKTFFSYILKGVIWGLGHKEVLTQVIADATAKNIPGVINDAGQIATDIATKQ